MFLKLGQFVSRRWWLIVLVWAAATLALRYSVPAWDVIAHDGNLAYLPAEMSSVQGEQLLRQAFPQHRAKSQMILVAARNDRPLDEHDFGVADALAEACLQAAEELGIDDLWTYDTRGIGEKLLSDDGHATLIALQMTSEFMAVDNIRVLDRVGGILDTARAKTDFPAGLELGVTGSAAVGGDMLASAGESIRNTELTTILMVVAILLVVYRAPLLVVVPLVTIGVSVVVGSAIVALLTQLHLLPGFDWWNFRVFTTTRIFIVVILFGAGTDFCLFLIARYKEELERGREQRPALAQALGGVGDALTGSALTTILGLSMMFFADFGKFRDSGPAIAICLAVTLLASLTLAPALLQATRGFVFWPSKLRVADQADMRERRSPHAHGWKPSAADSRRDSGSTSRLWNAVSAFVVRHPGAVLATSVLLLAPFAAAGVSVDITYDLLSELQSDRPSAVGSDLLRAHFPLGETGPLTVLVQDPAIDFRTREGRDLVSDLTNHLLEMEGIVGVRSVTQPLGEPIRGLGSMLSNRATRVMAAGSARAKENFVTPVEELAGSVTRFDLVLAMEPFSRKATQLLDAIENDLAQLRQKPQAPWRDAGFYFTGTTSGTRDLETVTKSDQVRIQRLVVIAVLAVLLVLLRQPIVCLYLILSVLFSYYVTLGATELLFGSLYPEAYTGLDWKVPIFLFVILIAVGEDYNIYLMTRVLEEQQRHGLMRGLRLAVARTGGIITSCGVIMAATFISMVTGTLRGMQELGCALSLGVLLDTLVVRPVLVPAFLALMYRLHGAPQEASMSDARRLPSPAETLAE